MPQFPCVCEICNCGRHRCPHKLRKPGPWDKCNLSEYDRNYVPHEVCPVKSLKPGYKPILGDGSISKDTTHRIDYIPHCVEPPKSLKPSEYVKPEGDMDDTTMYRKEYGPKEMCAPSVFKQPPPRTIPAKFQGESTNRSDFRPWCLPPRHIRKPDEYIPPSDKFDGIPSYVQDYIRHCVNPPKSCKPTNTFLQSDQPLNSETDYRQSYVPHPLQPKRQKDEVCYTRNRAPLDSLTVHRKEYTPKEVCRQKNYKPAPHFSQSDKPLSDRTTHRTDYIPHCTEPPQKKDLDKYKKPEGDMDLGTTYNKEYINMPICRNKAFVPPQINRIVAPFSDATSYRDNYQKWCVPKARPKHVQIYEPTTDPFDDCTTSKSAFVPHDICKQPNYKPEPHMMSEQPFDDTTMYRSEYTKKCHSHCPAAYLSTQERAISPDGYMYHNEDERGHLHYRRTQIEPKPLYNSQLNTSNLNESSNVVLPPLTAT